VELADPPTHGLLQQAPGAHFLIPVAEPQLADKLLLGLTRSHSVESHCHVTTVEYKVYLSAEKLAETHGVYMSLILETSTNFKNIVTL
jgi:hypothetical protein